MKDENNADSSTAADEVLTSIADGDFAAYQAQENARELAGKSGEPTKTEEAAPSTDKAATTEKAAGAEPGKETQERSKKTGEDRKAELKAEIDALLLERATLKGKIPGETKADPPTAKPVEETKKDEKAKAPDRPKIKDFTTLEEYDDAVDKYTRELVKSEAKTALEEYKASAVVQNQNKVIEDALQARQSEAREMFADFDTVALDKNTPISPAMDGWILKNVKSPGGLGMHVLYRLGENGAAEAKRIFALDAYDQAEELNKIRDAFKTKTPPAKTNAAAATAHTKAPPPATELNGRATEPADAGMAALKHHDFETYQRLENARELKTRRN